MEALLAGERLNLDIFWHTDESLDDVDSLPAPNVRSAEIVENLRPRQRLSRQSPMNWRLRPEIESRRHLHFCRMTRIDQRLTTRYIAVMGLGFIADLAVFAALHRALGVPLAQWAARMAGAAVGFWLHRNFTFRSVRAHRRPLRSQAIRFVFVWLVNYAASTSGILLAIAALAVDPVLAKLGIELILAVAGFVWMRGFVFGVRP